MTVPLTFAAGLAVGCILTIGVMYVAARAAMTRALKK
jgi:uncharacterized membrane protein YciS (DUF1049 family)